MEFYQATVSLRLRDIFTAFRNSKRSFFCSEICDLIGTKTDGEVLVDGSNIQVVLQKFLCTHYSDMFSCVEGSTIERWISSEIFNQIYNFPKYYPDVSEMRSFRLAVIELMEQNQAPLDYLIEFTVPVVYR